MFKRHVMAALAVSVSSMVVNGGVAAAQNVPWGGAAEKGELDADEVLDGLAEVMKVAG